MARRRAARYEREEAHVPTAVTSTPGVCTCGRPLTARGDKHIKPIDLPPTPPEVAAFEARLLGEREGADPSLVHHEGTFTSDGSGHHLPG